jgi:hypothetical protein
MQLGLPWDTWAMKPPLFIRPLTDAERRQVAAARRTADACRGRRAQSVLASARRLSPQPIAQLVGCSVHTVRHVIPAFNTQGVEGLEKQANRPKTVEPVLDAATCERLQHFLQHAPRLYGKPTGGDAGPGG